MSCEKKRISIFGLNTFYYVFIVLRLLLQHNQKCIHIVIRCYRSGIFSKSNRKFAKTSLLEKLGVAFLALPYAFTCESTLIYSLWFKMRDLTLLFKSRNMLLNIQYFHECDSRVLKIHYQGKYFLVQKYYTPVTAAKS